MHDVNDAPEMVAVDASINMAPPWCGEHHQSQARPTKGHVAHSNVRFIDVIELKDPGGRGWRRRGQRGGRGKRVRLKRKR